MKIIWKKKIFGKEVTSAVAGFNAAALSWSNWDLEMLVFVEGEKSSKQGETQQQPQPTDMVLGQNRTRETLVEASTLTTAPSHLPCLLHQEFIKSHVLPEDVGFLCLRFQYLIYYRLQTPLTASTPPSDGAMTDPDERYMARNAERLRC